MTSLPSQSPPDRPLLGGVPQRGLSGTSRIALVIGGLAGVAAAYFYSGSFRAMAIAIAVFAGTWLINGLIDAWRMLMKRPRLSACWGALNALIVGYVAYRLWPPAELDSVITFAVAAGLIVIYFGFAWATELPTLWRTRND